MKGLAGIGHGNVSDPGDTMKISDSTESTTLIKFPLGVANRKQRR
jgi:hypothetical protein